MSGSGQKTARELFNLNLVKAQQALLEKKMPPPQFQGALVELFVTHHMQWECVSGPTDKYDAEHDGVKIEIKSSKSERKPSTKGKEFNQFCWVRLDVRGTTIWVTKITMAPKGEAHQGNILDKERAIFDANPACSYNDWQAQMGISA